MLTHCPACSTIFRIHAEQIRARQGRVRCGRCRAVFDALDSLHDEPGLPVETALPLPAVTAIPPADFAESPPISAQIDRRSEPLFGISEWSQPAALGVPQASADDAVVETPPSLPGTFETPEPATPEAPADHPATMAASIEPDLPSSAAVEAVSEPAIPPDTAAAVAAEAMGKARRGAAAEARRARARHLAGVALWLIAGLALIAALGVQTVQRFHRDIVARFPAATDARDALCARLPCEWNLPRQIESIVIASSALEPLPGRPKGLLLSATLDNRSPRMLAYPHLELTLTNEREQPVLRRVITPDEYLKGKSPPESGLAGGGELVISLPLETSAPEASGYRLYVFYP